MQSQIQVLSCLKKNNNPETSSETINKHLSSFSPNSQISVKNLSQYEGEPHSKYSNWKYDIVFKNLYRENKLDPAQEPLTGELHKLE